MDVDVVARFEKETIFITRDHRLVYCQFAGHISLSADMAQCSVNALKLIRISMETLKEYSTTTPQPSYNPDTTMTTRFPSFRLNQGCPIRRICRSTSSNRQALKDLAPRQINHVSR